jgi:hypothetical protein
LVSFKFKKHVNKNDNPHHARDLLEAVLQEWSFFGYGIKG